MDLWFNPMVILFTKSGLPWQNPYLYLVISTDGIEKSSEVAKMVLDASTSHFQMSVVNQGSNICKSTKSILRDPMVRRKIGTLFGQDMLFKTKIHSSLMVYSGTQKRSLNGLIHHQLQSPGRVTESMRLTLVCHKSLEESAHTETSLISTWRESRIQVIMWFN